MRCKLTPATCTGASVPARFSVPRNPAISRDDFAGFAADARIVPGVAGARGNSALYALSSAARPFQDRIAHVPEPVDEEVDHQLRREAAQEKDVEQVEHIARLGWMVVFIQELFVELCLGDG